MKTGRKVFSALIAMLMVMAVFAVSALASVHTSDLTKNDFVYANGSDYYGNTNYIDSVADHTGFWVWENKHNKDSDLRASSLRDRSVGVGSTKSQVLSKFGVKPVQKVYSSDSYSNRFDPVDVPVEKVVYNYYKTGRNYYQAYYFDDEGSVCLIVWYNAAAN